MFKNLYLNKQIACPEAQLGQSSTLFQEQLLGSGECWEENEKEVQLCKWICSQPQAHCCRIPSVSSIPEQEAISQHLIKNVTAGVHIRPSDESESGDISKKEHFMWLPDGHCPASSNIQVRCCLGSLVTCLKLCHLTISGAYDHKQ